MLRLSHLEENLYLGCLYKHCITYQTTNGTQFIMLVDDVSIEEFYVCFLTETLICKL